MSVSYHKHISFGRNRWCSQGFSLCTHIFLVGESQASKGRRAHQEKERRKKIVKYIFTDAYNVFQIYGYALVIKIKRLKLFSCKSDFFNSGITLITTHFFWVVNTMCEPITQWCSQSFWEQHLWAVPQDTVINSFLLDQYWQIMVRLQLSCID